MNKIKAIITPVVEEVGKFAETASSQITGDKNSPPMADRPLDENNDTKKLVEDIYKPGEQKSPSEIVQNQAKDKASLAKTRAKLAAHQRYFQNEFSPPKPPEEPKSEELERKKKQEMVDLQQKEKKKPPPLAVQRAQRVEKYPGASG